jgi:tryptophan 2,3-dioxygenase
LGELYYSDYLRLDQLLSSQQLESERRGAPVHDEMLFVIVHQAFELWFKQILWELDGLMEIFGGERVDETEMGKVVAHLERITRIQQILTQQITVLETMTPLDFLEFRDYLIPASGFQSLQFRLIENKLGLPPHIRLRLGGGSYTASLSEEDRRQVELSEAEPSLLELVNRWLERTPFLDVGGFHFWEEYREAVQRMIEQDRLVVEKNPNLADEDRTEQLRGFEQTFAQYEAIFDQEKHEGMKASGERRFSHRAFQAALFLTLYRDEPAAQLPFRLLTALMDIDEGFVGWRYRHALMAQRMIGRRVGTGGSAGAAYLTRSAERSWVFIDLFQLSTFLIPRSQLPQLPPEVDRAMRFRFEPT